MREDLNVLLKMPQQTSLNFELLALESGQKIKCSSVAALVHLLAGHSQLFPSPEVDAKRGVINQDGFSVSITDISEQDEEENNYLVVLSGAHEVIADLRITLTEIVSSLGFKETLYVTRDDVSNEIAQELYPLLYQMEVSLRGYLTKFMTTKVGASWWKKTAPAEIVSKAKERRGNEKKFGSLTFNDLYLIDFKDLGELLYEQSSGFVTKGEIVNKILSLPEDPEELKKLKSELQSNYQKYFKESFADKDFKEKWNKFGDLRKKIAHSNLFTSEDLKEGKKLADEIIQIIESASEGMATVEITDEEKDALEEQAISRGYEPKKLTKEKFLEFIVQENDRLLKKGGGFIGLGAFMRKRISFAGFSNSDARRYLKELEEDEIVLIESIENPHNADRSTATIKYIGEQGVVPNP